MPRPTRNLPIALLPWPVNVALLPYVRYHRTWPLFLRAGAEIGINNTDPYIRVVRVRNDGGFKKYEQAHLARITSLLSLLDASSRRAYAKVLGFWLHARVLLGTATPFL